MLERASPVRALAGATALLALVPIGRILAAPLLVVVMLVAGVLLVAAIAGFHRAEEMAGQPVLRVLHGLEHACIKLLIAHGHAPHEGITKEGQFIVELADDPRATNAAVWQAAQEAIKRIAAGDKGLAFSPNCGTSFVVWMFLASTVAISSAFALLLGGLTLHIALGIGVATLVARVLARPLGLLAQRWWTVSADFTQATVTRVESVASEKAGRRRFTVTVDVEVAL